MELITKHGLGLNIISGILIRTKMAILLLLKMWPELQTIVKEHLVVPAEALLASVGLMKDPILVKAGIFHNAIVCFKFCVSFFSSIKF